MNRLHGVIQAIDSHGSMSLVEIAHNGDRFCAYVVGTPQNCAYLQEGRKVDLLVKETEVSLARSPLGCISIGNCFAARVSEVWLGRLLGQVALDYRGTKVTAVVGARAIQQMALQPGEEILWLIKSTELTLAEAS